MFSSGWNRVPPVGSLAGATLVAVAFSPSEVKAYYAVRVPALKRGRFESAWCLSRCMRGSDTSFAVNPVTGDGVLSFPVRACWDPIALEQWN